MYNPKKSTVYVVYVTANGVACEWDISIETTVLWIVLVDVECWNGKGEHAAARMHLYTKNKWWFKLVEME
jgi:hypothetical protein